MVYHLQIPSLKNLLYIVVAVILFSTLSSAAMERENRGKEMSPPSYMKRNDDTFPQEKPSAQQQRLSYYFPSSTSFSSSSLNFQPQQQQYRPSQAFYGRPSLSLSLSDLFRLNEFPNYG